MRIRTLVKNILPNPVYRLADNIRIRLERVFNVKEKIIGEDNSITYKYAVLKKVSFDIIGNNNIVIINNGCIINNVKFYIRGDNNHIILHEGIKCSGSSTFWTSCNNGYIEIGKNTSFENNVAFQIAENNLKIIVGEECMFSSNIYVWPQDWHQIIDKNGCRMNFSKDVIIGNHVWIGYDTKILKGVEIGNNNIVGANSLVTKKFSEQNVLIAGSPAIIRKRDINWTW